MVFKDSNLLRNSTSYKQQILLNDLSKTGIKEKSCWLDLDDFDLFENVAMDPMHDILEGVAGYVITFIVNYSIDMKILHFIYKTDYFHLIMDLIQDQNHAIVLLLMAQRSRLRLLRLKYLF